MGHHNPPSDIEEGNTPFGYVTTQVDDNVQQEVHPVEVFAEAWPGGSEAADCIVSDLLGQLGDYPDEAMVRVALRASTDDGSPYLRCLDVNGIGFASGSEEINGELVVELIAERWDSGHPIVRAV